MKYHYFKMSVETPSALNTGKNFGFLKFLEDNQDNFCHFLRVPLHLIKTFFFSF